ncbi:MAG TPA: lipid A biosynthesis acyltransferase [Burkholderiaceae bacterium]|nr:lipid A biosynthesis acyltransferase [Burkholderiaceae bacterium]
MRHAWATVALWLLRAIAALPYPAVRTIGNAAGSLTYWLAAPRRRISLINLRLCFPQRTERERERLAHAQFRYFVRSFIDRFILWYGSRERIERLVRIEGIEHFERHLGKPMILLAPHFAGLDAGGLRLCLDHRMATMYARQKNPVLDEAVRRGRARFNDPVLVSRTEGIRAAVRALRNGLPFYFLPDADLGPRDAVFVPFFGVPAATVTSTARLAAVAGAVVVPAVTRMTDDGYVLRFYPAWEDYPGDDVVAATQRMNEFIEQRILEMPEQYLWAHRRFKTRPPGEAGFYAER